MGYGIALHKNKAKPYHYFQYFSLSLQIKHWFAFLLLYLDYSSLQNSMML